MVAQGARRRRPQRGDLVAGPGRPPQQLDSAHPSRSRPERRRELQRPVRRPGLTLGTAKAKMAGLRLPSILNPAGCHRVTSFSRRLSLSLRPWSEAPAPGRPAPRPSSPPPGVSFGCRARTSLSAGSSRRQPAVLWIPQPGKRPHRHPDPRRPHPHPFPAGSQQPARACVSLMPAPLGWALYNSPRPNSTSIV